jgi:gas vesicle protein
MADKFANKSTATAFITGALLGAGIALLFAPQSGQKTRRKIRQFTETAGSKFQAARLELQNSVDEMVGDFEEKLQKGLNSGMNWSESKVADLRDALEATRKSIGERIEKIQSS